MKTVDLSVIVPSFSEEENLKHLLPRLKKSLNNINLSYEILIIDQRSSVDKTIIVCKKHKVVYVNRYPSNSYGDAVRTGIERSTGEKIIFMDADGSHDPEFISELYSHSHKSDIVIASRYIKNGGTENSYLLTLMSRVLNISYSLILGIPCKDISNSFKLYKSEHLKNIKLSCDNFDIVEEIIFKTYNSNSNIVIKEIPFFFKERKFGKTKRNLFIFILSYLFTIIKLKNSIKK